MKTDKVTNDHLKILYDYRQSIIDRNHYLYWCSLSERTKWYFLGTHHKRLDVNFSLPTENDNYVSEIIDPIFDMLYHLYGDEYIKDGGISNLIRYPFEDSVAIGELYVLKNIKTEIHYIAEAQTMAWKIPICLEIDYKGQLNWKIDLVRKMLIDLS